VHLVAFLLVAICPPASAGENQASSVGGAHGQKMECPIINTGRGLRGTGWAARSAVLAAALGAFSPSYVSALAPVPLEIGALLDQQQNIPDPAYLPFPEGIVGVSLGAFSGNPGARAQSFQPGYDTMVGASVYLLPNGPGQGNVKVEIGLFDTLDAAAGGGKPVRNAEAKGKAGTWLEASWLDDPVKVTLGATYFIVFSQSTGSEFFAFAGAQGSQGKDPYAFGGGFEQLGTTGGFVPLSSGGAGQQIDFAFRTYAIPEPGTGILLAAGLVLLGVIARRRLRG